MARVSFNLLGFYSSQLAANIGESKNCEAWQPIVGLKSVAVEIILNIRENW